MKQLKRRKYAHPNLLGLVAQVMIDWKEGAFERACKELRSSASDSLGFTGIEDLRASSYTIAVNPEQRDLSSHTNEFVGLMARHREGYALFVEKAGIRLVAEPPYRGRGAFFEKIDFLLNLVTAVDPSMAVPRVSILFSSRVVPPSEPYRIEEYITPRFEFDDESLENFDQFFHSVTIDLTRLAGHSVRAIVNIGTDVPNHGINLSVDVLDLHTTGLEEVAKRLALAKDLESHVFECTITDKTREIYGVIND